MGCVLGSSGVNGLCVWRVFKRVWLDRGTVMQRPNKLIWPACGACLLVRW